MDTRLRLSLHKADIGELSIHLRVILIPPFPLTNQSLLPPPFNYLPLPQIAIVES
jgi:hypothetical protein